jgi:ATP/maltotriose-dependent transcriptional regulator MalT
VNDPAPAVALLRDCLESRVSMLTAAAGWGKTTAVRGALDGRAHRWIDVASAPQEPGKLLWELSRAFGWPPEAPYGSVRAFAARIPGDAGTLVIDDAHVLADDPLSLDLLRALVEHRPDVRLVLIGREELPLPTATWIAAGIAALPVTETDLEIGSNELRALLRSEGVRDDDATVSAVLRFTRGWAVAVRFALIALRRSTDLTRVEAIGRDLAFRYLAEQMLGDLGLGIAPKQIALESGRSIETIRNQVKSAIRKMGVSGRLEAIATARTTGLI